MVKFNGYYAPVTAKIVRKITSYLAIDFVDHKKAASILKSFCKCKIFLLMFNVIIFHHFVIHSVIHLCYVKHIYKYI